MELETAINQVAQTANNFMVTQQFLSSFIWSVADLLRGDYKQSEYGKVILPFTVLRRLDCVLESTKAAVLAELAAKQKQDLAPEPFLLRKAGQSFYNTSPLDMKKLMGDQDHIRENLFSYIQAFAPAVRDIFERFEFYGQIERLAKAGLLYLVTERFAQVDLHPGKVSNNQMGLVFEELIRKFAEILGTKQPGSISLHAKSSGSWSIFCSSKTMMS